MQKKGFLLSVKATRAAPMGGFGFRGMGVSANFAGSIFPYRANSGEAAKTRGKRTSRGKKTFYQARGQRAGFKRTDSVFRAAEVLPGFAESIFPYRANSGAAAKTRVKHTKREIKINKHCSFSPKP